MTRENGQNTMERTVTVKRSMQTRIVGKFAILTRTSRWSNDHPVLA
jgi:hypothetical protein